MFKLFRFIFCLLAYQEQLAFKLLLFGKNYLRGSLFSPAWLLPPDSPNLVYKLTFLFALELIFSWGSNWSVFLDLKLTPEFLGCFSTSPNHVKDITTFLLKWLFLSLNLKVNSVLKLFFTKRRSLLIMSSSSIWVSVPTVFTSACWTKNFAFSFQFLFSNGVPSRKNCIWFWLSKRSCCHSWYSS